MTGTTSLYRFWSENYQGHFYTQSENEVNNILASNPNWRLESIAYDVVSLDQTGCEDANSSEIYRFWSDFYFRHFYTISIAERNNLISSDPNWEYEGAVYCAYTSEVSGSMPVYRFYSSVYQGHFYTMEKSERNHIIQTDPNWDYEGIAYYAYPYIPQDLEVLAITPVDNSTRVKVNTPINITFNQQVDRTSAEDYLTIAPQTNNQIEWSGNVMIYTPDSQFAYASTYYIHLQSGIQAIGGSTLDQTIDTQFTTRPESVLLNVPYTQQTDPFGCNATATAMVMNYRGVSTDENTIIDNIGAEPELFIPDGNPHEVWIADYGVYWEPLASYAQSQGLTTEIYQNWNRTAALNEVDKGNPVIIWWHNDSGSADILEWTNDEIFGVRNMHAGIIVGFKGAPDEPIEIYYTDPWKGANMTSTPSDFDSRWSTWRTGVYVPEDYRRVGLVIK